MPDKTWKCFAEGDEVVTQWAGQEARYTAKPTNVGRSNHRDAEAQAIFEAAARQAKRDKKKNIGRAPMLARVYDPLKIDWEKGVYCQPKLDGVRCIAYWDDNDHLVLQSRGGNDYPMEHIRKAVASVLPKGQELDGELYLHGLRLQKITSLVKAPKQGSKSIKYWVYDSPTGYDLSLIPEMENVLVVPNSPICHAHTDVMKTHENYTSKGFEGTIIRPRGAVYEAGKKSKSIQKLKDFQDAEYLVTNWKYGKGKFKDIPIFECSMENGDTFDVCPPGSLEERRAICGSNMLGRWMTVKYFNFTVDGVPSFPVGLGFRDPEEM